MARYCEEQAGGFIRHEYDPGSVRYNKKTKTFEVRCKHCPRRGCITGSIHWNTEWKTDPL